MTDKEPTQRQLYQVAELGKTRGANQREPPALHAAWLVDRAQPRVPGRRHWIFRDEIMAQIFDRGDPTPKRNIGLFTSRSPMKDQPKAPIFFNGGPLQIGSGLEDSYLTTPLVSYKR